MVESVVFRRARGDEADVLGDLTIGGVSYWGHDVNFPELVEDLRNNDLPTAEYIEESPVYVLEEGGERIGFYGLEDRGEHVELRYMFLGTDHIGKGHGRRLWNHAVAQAEEIGTKMRILSDPGAIGFYTAMGARMEGEQEVKPGFALGIFWYELGSS